MVDPSLKEEAAAAGRFTGARLFARQASKREACAQFWVGGAAPLLCVAVAAG